MQREGLRPGTRSVHPPEAPSSDRGLSPAIHQSSVFAARDLSDAIALEQDGAPVSSYTRSGNPTVRALELAVADLEEAVDAVAFPSGMAAMTAVLQALLHTGDTVVVSADAYAETLTALDILAKQMRLCVLPLDLCSPTADAVISAHRPAMVVCESISNPLLRVADQRRLATLVHGHGGLLVVDNTLATPVNLQPHRLGADVVVQSASKYLAGHYAVVAGVVTARAGEAAAIRHWRTTFGACLDPHAAWNVLQGMQTLGLRLERQNHSALCVAQLLQGHGAVSDVAYPMLDTHPDAGNARRQLAGGGGVVTFRLRADATSMGPFLESFRLARIAVSLGGTKTLVEAPLHMSHVGAPPPAAIGGAWTVDDRTVRISVGIEDTLDVLEDVEQALSSVALHPATVDAR